MFFIHESKCGWLFPLESFPKNIFQVTIFDTLKYCSAIDTSTGTDSSTGWGSGEVLCEGNDRPSLPHYQDTMDPRPGTICMFY